jgi:hypothetical protein
MVFERDLREEAYPDGTPPWLTEDEFLQKYRMHRQSFYRLLSLIENHPAFVSNGRKKQAPVKHQLLSFYFILDVLVAELILGRVVRYSVLVRGHATTIASEWLLQ